MRARIASMITVKLGLQGAIGCFYVKMCMTTAALSIVLLVVAGPVGVVVVSLCLWRVL
jgi:hypothetical protein